MKVFSVRALFLSTISLLSITASGDEYGGAVSAREIARTTITADGQPVRYLKTDKPEVTAVVVEIPPGQETGWHFHSVPVYAYVIEGTLHVAMENGEVRAYHPGDAIVEMVGTPHNGENRGAGPVRLVAFYTGEQGKPNTTKVPQPE